MGLLFSKEEKENEIQRLRKNYDLWVEEVKKDGDSLMCSFYEDSMCFAKASSFTTSELGKINIVRYEKSYICYKEVDTPTEKECSICLCNLQKPFSKKYTNLKCGHSFHTKCFNKHIQTQFNQGLVATCPLCRYGKSPDEEKIQNLKNQYFIHFGNHDSDFDSDYSYNSD